MKRSKGLLGGRIADAALIFSFIIVKQCIEKFVSRMLHITSISISPLKIPYRNEFGSLLGVIGPHKILNMQIHIIFICNVVNLLQTLKKCLITISPKHSITSAIEGNVIDITYAGEQEIHTVLKDLSLFMPQVGAEEKCLFG